MRGRLPGLFLAIVIAASRSLAQEEDPWVKYKPRSLHQVIKEHAAVEFKDPRIKLVEGNDVTVLAVDSAPSRSKVIYTGKSRPVSKSRRAIISAWVKTLGMDSRYLELFEREMCFIEGSTQYWLPLQRQLMPHLEDELKKGEPVILFVAWIGAKQSSGKIDWLFIVNEFEKP